MISYRKINTAVCGLLVAGVLTASPAAAVTQINSNAFDIKVRLDLLNLVTAGLGPFAQSSGDVGAAYSDVDTHIGVTQNLSLGIVLQDRVKVGALSTSASSNGTNFGTANARVASTSLNLGLINLTPPDFFGDLLNIGSGVITSTSSANGNLATGTVSGASGIANLKLTGSLVTNNIANLNVTALANANPAPNTTLFFINVLGVDTLKIILNEQTTTISKGIKSIATNAIHVIFADLSVAGIGVLRGDIIVGHSYARITDTDVVPEPATWLQMIAGFGTIGFVTRRRRAQAKRLLATAA